MNDRSIIQTPGPQGSGNWLESYMVEGPIAPYERRPQLIDMSAIRGILFRQRWLVLAVIALALIGGFVVTLLSTPVYEAEATILVDPVGKIITEEQNVASAYLTRDTYERMATQAVIIRSRNTADLVAEELKLGERYDLLGESVDESRPPNRTDEQWVLDKQKKAGQILADRVQVDVPTDDYVLTIRYQSESPVLAAAVANAYADVFAQTDTRDQVEENEYAQEYLKEQIQLVRARLEDAELEANAYARNRGIIVQQSMGEESDGAMTVTTANLASINERVSQARARRIEAEQLWRSIQRLPASQLPEVQSNPVLQNLLTVPRQRLWHRFEVVI